MSARSGFGRRAFFALAHRDRPGPSSSAFPEMWRVPGVFEVDFGMSLGSLIGLAGGFLAASRSARCYSVVPRARLSDQDWRFL